MVMVPIVLVISGMVSKDWGQAALFCISVAVGITPEMLPVVINANLCRAALKLAKLKVIVKRLDSVQSLGAIDVLCSDKTGTLTRDDITLHTAVDAFNSPSEMTFQYAFLNSFFQEGLRNAIDSAIMKHAETRIGDGGLEKWKQEYEKVAELPFDFERRLLSIVLRDSSNVTLMITKGAAEEVISKCTHIYTDGEHLLLDHTRIEHLGRLTTLLNQQGMRTVAVATRTIVIDKIDTITSDDESQLTFQGFLAFLDPPKDDAEHAINDLQGLGVAIKILTGDNAAAAKSVAFKIGLLNHENQDAIISGPELAALDEKSLQESVERCVVFAKLKPLQKQEIVRLLIRNGHSVGFLGDGINDAPALRSADVGISVDSGTSVAKHAANIILLQKSLAHVVNGVIYGRITHANTMKYIKMAASSNFGNIFSVTVAAAWLPYLPMHPLQLLIQNLMYDLSQSAIPWDHVDPEMTLLPRKWNVWSIVRFMIWFGPTSSIFDIVTFLIGWFVLCQCH
jgi:Mg2+-importing ATPase